VVVRHPTRLIPRRIASFPLFRLDADNIVPLQSPPPPETPPQDLLHNSADRFDDESPEIFDDTQKLIATCSRTAKKARLRKSTAPFEIPSEDPPQ